MDQGERFLVRHLSNGDQCVKWQCDCREMHFITPEGKLVAWNRKDEAS